MHRLRTKYIALSKAFRQSQGDKDSVLALYRLKKRLERLETKEAKEVLVDVYDLLHWKKKAFTLLLEIGDHTDPKTLKKNGSSTKVFFGKGRLLCHSLSENKKGISKRARRVEKTGDSFFPIPSQSYANRGISFFEATSDL